MRSQPVSEPENGDGGEERYPAPGLDPAQEDWEPVAYAHCAGYSLVLSGFAAFFLATTIAVGLLLGNSADPGTVSLVGVCYVVLFFAGSVVGLPRPAMPRIEPLAAMRALSIWRLVLVVCALIWAAWTEPGDGRGVEAALSACLLLGAIVDGVCLGRVAIAWRVGPLGAVAVALSTALPSRAGPRALPGGEGR